MRAAVVMGTRPEAIKLWPVVTELERRSHRADILATWQSRDVLGHVMTELGLGAAAVPLPPLANQTPLRFASEAADWIDACLESRRYDLVIVQGDTTSAFAGAIAGFLNTIPVAHVEAGLRSDRLDAPFPEEGFRRLIAQISRYHFAPTPQAAARLRAEHVLGEIWQVGNTVVDALRQIKPIQSYQPPADVLVTFHRREGHEHLVDRVIPAISELSQTYLVRWFAHPAIESTIRQETRYRPGSLQVEPPASYRAFLGELARAGCVVTDSGGVVEEAVTLGRPLVVVRDATERPEALVAGATLLPFAELGRLPEAVSAALRSGPAPSDAFGDGQAAKRIVDALERGL